MYITCTICTILFTLKESNNPINQSLGVEMECIILQEKYKIIRKIGEGSFSAVYLAKHIVKNTDVAVKFSLPNNEISKVLLKNEIDTYLCLVSHKLTHIANIKSIGNYQGVNYIIMDHLYMDLETYFKHQSHNLDIIHIKNLLGQVLYLIKHMHDAGLVHRDVKPENFLFNKQRKLCIIDMGLSIRYNSQKETNNPIGTPLYSSYHVHRSHYKYRCRDDIISVFFMFIYLTSGTLPWQNIHCHNKSIQEQIYFLMKNDTNLYKYYSSFDKYETLIKPIIDDYYYYKDYNMLREYH
jgi:serine/threonine protein kinase